jgi:hypothetical protein
MRNPKSFDLPEKQLLLGKLAHEVVNEMYKQKQHWAPAEAREFGTAMVADLVPRMAAGLLLPAAAAQLREAKEAIPASVEHLCKLLNDIGAEVEGCEVPLRATLNATTTLNGNLDMLVKLSNDRRLVLDFKWSSKPFFYRTRIVDGKALQLAIYGWLVNHIGELDQQASESSNVLPFSPPDPRGEFLPPAGFYMLRHGQLFFTEAGIFPDYTLVRKAARSLSETWRIAREAYDRELTKLRAGTVVATGINDDTIDLDAFINPEISDPPCAFCRFGRLCGKEQLQ